MASRGQKMALSVKKRLREVENGFGASNLRLRELKSGFGVSKVASRGFAPQIFATFGDKSVMVGGGAQRTIFGSWVDWMVVNLHFFVIKARGSQREHGELASGSLAIFGSWVNWMVVSCSVRFVVAVPKKIVVWVELVRLRLIQWGYHARRKRYGVNNLRGSRTCTPGPSWWMGRDGYDVPRSKLIKLACQSRVYILASQRVSESRLRVLYGYLWVHIVGTIQDLSPCSRPCILGGIELGGTHKINFFHYL